MAKTDRKQRAAEHKKPTRAKPKKDKSLIAVSEQLLPEPQAAYRVPPEIMRWWNSLSTTQQLLLISAVIVMGGLLTAEIAPILMEMLKAQDGQMASPAHSRTSYPTPVLPMAPEKILPTDTVKPNTQAKPAKPPRVDSVFFQPPETKQVSSPKEQPASKIMSVDQIKKKISVDISAPYRGRMISEVEKNQYLVTLSERLHGFLEEDPHFAMDFELVLNEPSYRVKLMSIQNDAGALFNHVTNELQINLNYVGNSDFIRTMRHETHHMKMKKLFMSVSANQIDDLEYIDQYTCPYYVLPEQAVQLNEQFLWAIREDDGFISKMNAIYQKRQQQQVLTKAEERLLATAEKAVEKYVPIKIHKRVLQAEFEEEKQKIVNDIEEQGYAISYVNPREKNSLNRFPMYFKEYKPTLSDGEQKIIYMGYSVINPEQNKLQAFLNDYKYRTILVLSRYLRSPNWLRDLEYDAHIEENGRDVNDVMFPNRKKFHLELDKLIQQKLQTNENLGPKPRLR